MGGLFEEKTDEELIEIYEKTAIDTSICQNAEDSEQDTRILEAVIEEMESRGMVNTIWDMGYEPILE